jgi:surface-adhesin protein E
MIGAKTGLRIHLITVSYLLMLVAACSRPVATDWIAVNDTAPTADGFVTYAAPSTIRKTGTTVKMLSMIDFKVIPGAALDRPHFSWIDEWEYECQYKSLRPIGFREYAGNMGTGENVFSLTSPAFQGIAVKPGTVSEALWKMACGKE